MQCDSADCRGGPHRRRDHAFGSTFIGAAYDRVGVRLAAGGADCRALLAAVATYRDQKHVLAAAAAISFAANAFNISAVYLVASGLPIERPTYREHFVIVPVANMVAPSRPRPTAWEPGKRLSIYYIARCLATSTSTRASARWSRWPTA